MSAPISAIIGAEVNPVAILHDDQTRSIVNLLHSFTRHCESGALAAEHFMALITTHQGRLLRPAGS
jgi:hypothetical protein